MKTAIKLVLIDLLIAQIIAPILIMIPCTIYLFVTTGNLDKVTLTQMIMIPAQLAGQIMLASEIPYFWYTLAMVIVFFLLTLVYLGKVISAFTCKKGKEGADV